MGGTLATGSSIYMTSAGVPAADGAGLSSIKSFSQLLTSIAALPLAGGTLTGNLLFTDDTYTIGAAGATRPSAVHVGTGGVTAAGAITTTGTVSGTSPSPFTSGVIAKGPASDNNWGGGINFTANNGTVHGYIRSDNTTLYQTKTTFSDPLLSAVYTFATVPAASSHAGGAIRISDRSQKWAYSDGTDWRFFVDGAVIS